MKLYEKFKPEEETQYITAPTGSGKTWQTALLYLKKLAEAEPHRKELTHANKRTIDDSQRGRGVFKSVSHDSLALVPANPGLSSRERMEN